MKKSSKCVLRSYEVVWSCQWCGLIKNKQPKHGSLFCSNICHGQHVSFQLLNVWLAGGEIKSRTTPNYIRSFLFKEQGGGCLSCNKSVWLDSPIPLQIDHIDGDHANMKRDNVCLICPNCHALKATSGSKNKGSGRAWRRSYDKNKNVVVQEAFVFLSKN